MKRSYYIQSWVGLMLFMLWIPIPSVLAQDTFRDNFNTNSYSNNNGTNNFSVAWNEDGETTNPNNGRIVINNNRLELKDLDNGSIRRYLDLSAYTDVTLTLDYDRLNGNESISVQLHNGTDFVEVTQLTGSGTSLSYALPLAYIGTHSAIRFASASGGWGSAEMFYIDNIEFYAITTVNLPPVISGTGNQILCPNATLPIAQSVSITDPDDTGTVAVYIQISTGYVNGEDSLTLTGTHPSISTSWDAVQGELTLNGPATYTEFEAAILDVEYTSSSSNPTGQRQFSITLGEANYLPFTGHYYEYVVDSNISWTDAETDASNRTYYGLQGYLATLTSQIEADFSGSQAQGVGWIGATDAGVEGEWRWVTGPEAGTQFWSGDENGTELTFAFWNANEPNDHPNDNVDGQENYAHITDVSVTSSPGSWNDLPNVTSGNGPWAAQGYVVEYGGMPGDPTLNLTLTTTIAMSDCQVITNRRITYRAKTIN